MFIIIYHFQTPVGGPLEPSLCLKLFRGPTHVNERTNEHTNTLTDKPTTKQTWRIAIPHGSSNKTSR